MESVLAGLQVLLRKQEELVLFPLHRSVTGKKISTEIAAAANERAIAGEMKKARMISEDGIIGYNIMVALKEYASHVKAARKSRRRHHYFRCRTSYRASGTGKRKSDKDRTHRIYRQIRKSNPEILGQKIQKNCRSGSDRRVIRQADTLAFIKKNWRNILKNPTVKK